MPLSVVMPVYNEQDIIEVVVNSVYSNIISKISESEFIIVDDCSKDNTLSILNKLAKKYNKIKVIHLPKNMGHPGAIRVGYNKAKYDWTFHIDSDNQFDPKEYWRLDKFKGAYDFVLGYRKHRHDPMHRLVLTRLLRLVNFLFFGINLKDIDCPFRIMNTNAVRQIMPLIPKDSFAPSIIIFVLANKLGYRIKEVEVSHFPRVTGKVSLMGWKLIKFSLKGLKNLCNLSFMARKLPPSVYAKASEIRKEIDANHNT